MFSSSISFRRPPVIHKAIWDEIEDAEFVLPPRRRLTLAAYATDGTQTAYVEPVGIGDTLPDMPLFLTPESYVPTPLETTYQSTWAVFPTPLKPLLDATLERGERLPDEPPEE
jgi:hypothetical protein